MLDQELFSYRLEQKACADEMFVSRWSPRAMVKTDIPDSDVKKMLDAARWSPSCFNDQPWHFVVSTDATFDTFLELLLEGNQVWCKNASRIGFVLARKHFQANGNPNAFSQFDTGAAWMSFVYQAYALGYAMHGLGGIHKDRVYEKLDIDATKYDVVCGFVIGKRGDKEKLPDNLKEREKPSKRVELDDLYHLNRFGDAEKLD